MTEKVVIPPADQIDIYPRRHTTRTPDEFRLYEPEEDLVPAMAHAGEGYRFHVTGLTHDERGYPSMNVETQDRLVAPPARQNGSAGQRQHSLRDRKHSKMPTWWWSPTASPPASPSAPSNMARDRGVRAGKFRLISAWPFPEERIRSLAAHVKALVVPELNLGQMVCEVERAARGQTRVIPIPHAGGSVHDPQQILEAILEAAL